MKDGTKEYRSYMETWPESVLSLFAIIIELFGYLLRFKLLHIHAVRLGRICMQIALADYAYM